MHNTYIIFTCIINKYIHIYMHNTSILNIYIIPVYVIHTYIRNTYIHT